MPHIDLIAADAGRLHAARRHCDHLGVGDRTRCPDELRAHLVRLAPLLEATFVGREDRTRVAKPQRERHGAQLPRGEPGHRHGALTDQGDNIAIAVRELEQAPALLTPQPELEHVHALDQWRDDVPVTPTPHLGEQ